MSYCSTRRRQWHPTPVLLPGKSHGWRSLEDCSPWGRWGLDTTERLHFPFSLTCTGEGNGNPLQCSCLENPRDRGAWWAAVYGVTQSWTWLKWQQQQYWFSNGTLKKRTDTFREYVRNFWTIFDFVMIYNEFIEAQIGLVTWESGIQTDLSHPGNPVRFQEQMTAVVIVSHWQNLSRLGMLKQLECS